MSLDFKRNRAKGVPIMAIETQDPAATIKACLTALNGKQEITPLFEWDMANGCIPMNKHGIEVMAELEIETEMTLNPTEFLSLFRNKAKLKGSALDVTDKNEPAVFFVHQADRLVRENGVCQAIWNCRDVFKAHGINLVLLSPSFNLPEELRQDVVVIDDPLPDAAELERIAASVSNDMGPAAEKQVKTIMPKVVNTLRGASGFAAEQMVAMALSSKGVDMPTLVKLKRKYIAALPGIEVREDKITFDDIAGYDNFKGVATKKIKGKRPPDLTLWLDELEKAWAGANSDTSGTTQDQVGTILTWMQDRLNEDRLSAALLVGFPGTGKSACAMAIRNEAQCECLRMDMGGMKDSLVGSSEKRIRAVLKTIDAMSGGHILVLGTCNSIGNLPAPLISRFALGTYFFDLPTKEENESLWQLKRKKYGIPDDQQNPSSDGWTGREIQQCCFMADDLQIPLKEAAQYITPFKATGVKEIELLRKQAHKRFLSATTPGFYTMPEDEVATGRRMTM